MTTVITTNASANRRRRRRIASWKSGLLICAVLGASSWSVQAFSSPSSLPSSSRTSLVLHTFSPARSTQQRRRRHHSSSRNYKNFDYDAAVAQSTTASLERAIRQAGWQGQTDHALQLYQTALRADVGILHIRHLNAALDAMARTRRRSTINVTAAEELIAQSSCHHQLTPNVYTLGALLNVCAKAAASSSPHRSLAEERALYWLQHQQHHHDNNLFPTSVQPNAVCYQAAMSAFVTTSYQQVCDIFRQAQDDQVALTVVGYNTVLAAAAKAGRWQDALGIVQHMLGETTDNDNDNNNNALSNDEYDDDNLLLASDDCRDAPPPDRVSWGTLLAACETAQEWSVLLQQAARMKRHYGALDLQAYTSCLRACQQLQQPVKAVALLEQMKQISSGNQDGNDPSVAPDAVAYCLVISALARDGQVRPAIRLLTELEEEQGATVEAYTAAIVGPEVTGDWRAAFGLVERMRYHDVQPNHVTFCAVLGACASACAQSQAYEDEDCQKAQKQALRLLKVMKKDDSVVNPNVPVYNAAMRVCAEGGNLAQAFALYHDMLEQIDLDGTPLQPNIVTFGTLMTACERVDGDMEGVSRVFRYLRDFGLEPNAIVYGAALSACRKAQESERAYALLQQMIDQHQLRPNMATFHTALRAQTAESSPVALERALGVFALVQKYAKPNRQTFQILVQALAQQFRRPADAEALLQQMRRQYGIVPDVDLYTTTITAYEKCGQPLQALQLMESMRQDGYDFYNVPVLDAAFKRLVKLASSVQRGWKSSSRTSSRFNDTSALLDGQM